MRTKIITYLLVFVSLILLYQMVSSNKLVAFQAAKIEQLDTKKQKLQDSLEQIQLLWEDQQYFSLIGNAEGMDAFPGNRSAEEITQLVSDALYEYNVKEQNPFISYAGMEGRFFFNKVQVLNNRWLIADFSDQKYWGEVLLQYRVNEDGSVTFELITDFLYPISELQ